MPNITLKKTKDGSLTYFNEQFGECYHSPNGALREAFEKHAGPSEVQNIENAKVLDYCFGLGYNAAAAIDLFLKSNHKKIEIVGIELDKEILLEILKENADFKSFDIIKEMIRAGLDGKGFETVMDGKTIKTRLFVDDCLKIVPSLGKEHFDIVFFDPFSFKKCPELWSEEAFRQVFLACKKGAVLTTYSCAKVVRENMKKAGFLVKVGPDIDNGHPGTICIKE